MGREGVSVTSRGRRYSHLRPAGPSVVPGFSRKVVKMRLASRFAAAAAAAFMFATIDPPAEAASGPCEQAIGFSILPSPFAPWKGTPLRVMIVTEKPLSGVISLVAPDGSVAAKAS